MRKIREELAELCHEQWSGWMKYLFSKCVSPIEPNTGTVVIPAWAVERWERQMNTPYKDLSEVEKNSDRKEADRFIKLLNRVDAMADDRREKEMERMDRAVCRFLRKPMQKNK